jgi:hypothetical protein
MASEDMGAIASPDEALIAILSPAVIGAIASEEEALMDMALSPVFGEEQAARAARVSARAVRVMVRVMGGSSDGLGLDRRAVG